MLAAMPFLSLPFLMILPVLTACAGSRLSETQEIAQAAKYFAEQGWISPNRAQ